MNTIQPGIQEIEATKAWCSTCECLYPEWLKKCPQCLIALEHTTPHPASYPTPRESYQHIVERIRTRGGTVQLTLSTTDASQVRRWHFPYQGYGFAWATRLQGALGSLTIDLRTTDIGVTQRWRFPYQGYGFGWMRRLDGHIDGHPLSLTASSVEMTRKWSFPYFGFGFGWTDEMKGACGEDITAHLKTTDVTYEKKYRFPYLGYGFAWVKESVLTLKLRT